ncbi:hypothetical protein DEJ45_13495 [Streptomyces venezuelae]|nr:hypothetical protein DEJ45_13495 [Streptomyces venezuelae]
MLPTAGGSVPLRGASFPTPPLPELGLRPRPRSSNAGRADLSAPPAFEARGSGGGAPGFGKGRGGGRLRAAAPPAPPPAPHRPRSTPKGTP